MSLYDLALSIAKEAHKGQVDKSGTDYIQHPIYVASLVDTEYEKATALLHDVIEDSDLTLSDLRDQDIPNEVVMAVGVLTKNKNISYKEYLNKVKSNELARIVKLADLQHNSDLTRIDTLTDVDIKRVEKYKKAINFLK